MLLSFMQVILLIFFKGDGGTHLAASKMISKGIIVMENRFDTKIYIGSAEPTIIVIYFN